MEINIVAFGIARDIIGSNQLKMEVKSDLTVSEIMSVIKSKFPKFEELTSILLAVNESYAPDDQVINEGDELVLIPPVSGG